MTFRKEKEKVTKDQKKVIFRDPTWKTGMIVGQQIAGESQREIKLNCKFWTNQIFEQLDSSEA